MWKFVTRGIRETLERRTCRTNIYSQTSQDPNSKNEVKTNLTCNHKFLAPSLTAFNKQLCGSTRTTGTKDKDNDSNWNTKYSWSDAIGWTSILAVGWVVCQTLCLRRRIFEKEENNLTQVPEARISTLINQVLNLGPRHILPIINCVGTSKIYAQENTEAESNVGKPFGPLTIEEALKEATAEFANTHKLAMAEFELHYGLKALEDRRYKDAIKHFTAGASLSSASSMFNLGLCYELGLGTLVDHAKAAKYYNDAAKRGHADATYNLGVFHAQGRGGFTVDTDRARSYFIKAAKLGQSQAQHALDLEKRYRSSKEKENATILDERKNILQRMRNNESVTNILKKLTNHTNSLYLQSELEFLDNADRMQAAAVACKTPAQLVLDLFGLNEPNVLSNSMESNNCSVPC